MPKCSLTLYFLTFTLLAHIPSLVARAGVLAGFDLLGDLESLVGLGLLAKVGLVLFAAHLVLAEILGAAESLLAALASLSTQIGHMGLHVTGHVVAFLRTIVLANAPPAAAKVEVAVFGTADMLLTKVLLG